MRRGRRLGIDVGDVRIGVAISDPDGMIATPLETVLAGRGALERLAALVQEYEIFECVVGLPVSLSGRESHAAAKVRVFTGDLLGLVQPVSVRLFDERMSTMTADSLLRERGKSGQKKRAVIDQAAASVILQTALDAERTSAKLPGETVGD